MSTTLLNISLLLFIGLAVPLVAGDVCTFPTLFTVGGRPGTVLPASAVRACFNAVPFSPSIRNRTVAVLRDMFSLYSFTEIASKSGPPYFSNVDAEAELNRISATTYPSDYAMVTDIQRLFNRLYDAHTIYIAPPAYANWVVCRPFSVNATSTSSGGIRFAVGGEATALGARWSLIYNLTFGSLPDLAPYIGKTITRINNVDTLTYIQQYADAGGMYRSRGVRLNAALKSGFYNAYLDRAPRLNISDSETYTFSDGTSVTLSLPVLSFELVFKDIPSLQRSLLPSASKREVSASPKGPADHRPIPREVEELEPHPFEPEKVRPKRRIEFTEAPLKKEMEQRDTETHELATRGLTSIATSEGRTVAAAHTTINGKKYVVLTFRSFYQGSSNFTRWLRSYHTTIKKALDYGRANNISELLIDLTSNGGGFICLEAHTLAALFPSINANKALGPLVRDFRLKGGPNSPYGKLVRELWGSRLSVPCTTTAITSTSQWLNPPATLTRGNYVGNYTRLNNYNCFSGIDLEFDFANVNVTQNYYHFKKVIILTDGTCGSACAHFVTTAMITGQATVITYGGRPSEKMDSASFAGGNVERWSSFVSAANRLSATTGLTLSNLPTTAYTSFNFAAGYAPGGTIPRDFALLPATINLPIWPGPSFKRDELYAAAVPYFECAVDSPSSAPCVVPVQGNTAA